MAKRKSLSTKTKLASALLALGHIPYEESKTLTADEIISRFEFDHTVYHAIGGTDDPWNLTPLLKAEHRAKTSKVDISAIAKSKRLTKKTEQHAQARNLAGACKACGKSFQEFVQCKREDCTWEVGLPPEKKNKLTSAKRRKPDSAAAALAKEIASVRRKSISEQRKTLQRAVRRNLKKKKNLAPT